MNPHTKAAARAHAEECVKLVNERFGLQLALRHVLLELGHSLGHVDYLAFLAKNRKIEEFKKELMK